MTEARMSLGEFDYPSYTNPITPADGTSLPEGGKYDQPTVYYNPDSSSPDGSYSFTFSITAPQGDNKVWKPVLYDRNIDDFSVEVYQKGFRLETTTSHMRHQQILTKFASGQKERVI